MTYTFVFAGYVGDNEANATTFDSEGWLKTGDLCYIDQDGFLFVVDRLKELIKYKAYQVYSTSLKEVSSSTTFAVIRINHLLVNKCFSGTTCRAGACPAFFATNC